MSTAKNQIVATFLKKKKKEANPDKIDWQDHQGWADGEISMKCLECDGFEEKAGKDGSAALLSLYNIHLKEQHSETLYKQDRRCPVQGKLYLY